MAHTPGGPVRTHAHQRRAFLAHAAVFAVSIVGMVLINAMVNLSAGIAGEWSTWWSIWALLGWSIGVAVHCVVVLVNRPAAE